MTAQIHAGHSVRVDAPLQNGSGADLVETAREALAAEVESLQREREELKVNLDVLDARLLRVRRALRETEKVERVLPLAEPRPKPKRKRRPTTPPERLDDVTELLSINQPLSVREIHEGLGGSRWGSKSVLKTALEMLRARGTVRVAGYQHGNPGSPAKLYALMDESDD